MTQPIVLLDLDGPFFDWGAGFNRTLLELDPDFPITDPSTWTEFFVYSDDRYAAFRETVERAYAHPGLYDSLEPVPGAGEALEEMSKHAHLLFCSTADTQNPTCESDKKNAVSRHYGSTWAKRLILTPDKTVIHGDLIIDDRPDIHGAVSAPSWVHAVYDSPYNQEKDTGLRVRSDWTNWQEVFEKAGII